MNCPKSQSILQSTFVLRISCLCVLLFGTVLDAHSVQAQGFGGFGGFQNVGGVRVDGQGVIQDIRPQLREDLAGTREQLQAVVEADLIPPVLKLLATSSELAIKKEAAWVIANASDTGAKEQIE